MAIITFATPHAACAFVSMCEGTEEVQRDNGDAESLSNADALCRLMDACGPCVDGTTWPAVVIIEDRDVPHAVDTACACLEAAEESGLSGDAIMAARAADGDDGEYVLEGEIAVSP